MKHTCGIYLITNTVNDLKYVGQSIDIYNRWKQHQSTSKNEKEQNKLYQAIRKYGIENFNFKILEECEKDQLNEREIYWINYYNSFNNGYNMTHGGQGAYGWKFNPEEIRQLWDEGYTTKAIQEKLGCSQQLISDRLKGYNNYNRITSHTRNFYEKDQTVYRYSLTGEYIDSYPCAGMAAKILGYNCGDCILSCIYKKINSAYGYQWSKEKVDKLPPVPVPHGKLVQCIETKEIFTSTREAAIAYNLKSHTNIVDCCNGKKKSAGKHKITGEKLHWKYI